MSALSYALIFTPICLIMAERSHPDSFRRDINNINHLDTRGLRYTSYPSAAQCQADFSVKDLEEELSSVKAKTFEPLSIYLHIPFCENLCYYCACNKIVTRNQKEAEAYLMHLEKEMSLLHKHIGHQRRVTQLHIGGGSPTFLDAAQLTQLVHMLSRYFHLIDNESREYCIEIDPRTINSDYLALLKGLGFNRISLGIQDFTLEVQQAVNRVNDYNMVKYLVDAARDYGFSSINFDLIYGLPKQTVESLMQTIAKVIQLNPDRISFYHYNHQPEQHSAQKAIDEQQLPSAAEKTEMLQCINSQLAQAGYLSIGMDQYVKPEDSLAKAQREGHLLRNFQGYSASRATDMIGIGLSSISSGETYLSQNVKDLATYYQSLDNNQLPVEKGIHCSSDDMKRRSVIMSLVSNFSLDIKKWEKRYSESFKEYFAEEGRPLETLEKEGLLQLSDTKIAVTERGKTAIGKICVIFDLYHNQVNKNFFKVN